jgi:hypothetical protein
MNSKEALALAKSQEGRVAYCPNARKYQHVVIHVTPGRETIGWILFKRIDGGSSKNGKQIRCLTPYEFADMVQSRRVVFDGEPEYVNRKVKFGVTRPAVELKVSPKFTGYSPALIEALVMDEVRNHRYSEAIGVLKLAIESETK